MNVRHLTAAVLLCLTPALLAAPAAGQDKPSAATAPSAMSDAKVIEAQLMHYPLDVCIVKGDKLDADAVNVVYEGRLVRFCCGGCAKKFKADPAKYIAELDKKIVEQQVKDYPLDVCVISGEKLGGMGEPVNYFYQNRLVRFCCGGCVKRFEADPDKAMAKLDKAYADAQRADYPLQKCVVSGAELGSMGDPYEIVAGTRLVRFCCKGCVPKFQAEPAKYLARIPTP